MAQNPPQIAIIGAGIFVKSQYLPRLAEISDLVTLKAIWSRSEKSAREAGEIARKVFGNVECKWGDNGFEEIVSDPDIVGVIVALAGQIQGGFILDMGVRVKNEIIWRVVGLNGTVQVERGNKDGQHGYVATLFTANKETKSSFYPFSGVTKELKAFLSDISRASLQKGDKIEAKARLSYIEGAQDVAVLDAMLESGMKHGAMVKVKKF